jgi:hypothetical protein
MGTGWQFFGVIFDLDKRYHQAASSQQRSRFHDFQFFTHTRNFCQRATLQPEGELGRLYLFLYRNN